MYLEDKIIKKITYYTSMVEELEVNSATHITTIAVICQFIIELHKSLELIKTAGEELDKVEILILEQLKDI